MCACRIILWYDHPEIERHYQLKSIFHGLGIPLWFYVFHRPYQYTIAEYFIVPGPLSIKRIASLR